MAFEVSKVMNAMEGRDFARPNLFEVDIPFLDDSIRFKCKAANVPDGEVGVVEVSYMNRKMKIAGDRTFGQWTITVYADDAQKTHEQFLQWQALQQTHGRTSAGATPDVYLQVGYVRRFDRNGDVVKEYEMQEIWPSNVGGVSLDWDNNDQVETFDVTLEINSWEPV